MLSSPQFLWIGWRWPWGALHVNGLKIAPLCWPLFYIIYSHVYKDSMAEMTFFFRRWPLRQSSSANTTHSSLVARLSSSLARSGATTSSIERGEWWYDDGWTNEQASKQASKHAKVKDRGYRKLPTVDAFTRRVPGLGGSNPWKKRHFFAFLRTANLWYTFLYQKCPFVQK